MEMIERYLQAVRFWLPNRQKDDIIAELSADIYAQVEEREAELGRKLSNAEVEAILKQRGRPVLVASRFQPQGYLIGPLLFPIYRFVLQIVAACYLVPWVLVALCLMIFSPAYRLQHFGGTWMNAIASAWSGLWTAAFVAFGLITLVFAILERAQARCNAIEDWTPRNLPPVHNLRKISRANSIVELIVNQIFLFWWVAYFHSSVLSVGLVQIAFSPLWIWFYWGFLLLAVANAALAVVNLVRPYWTVQRATLRMLSETAGAALFCWLMQAGIVTGFRTASLSPEKGVYVVQAINHWTTTLFPVAVIVGVIVVVTGTIRVVRIHTDGQSQILAR
jgi:hypothetical protein